MIQNEGFVLLNIQRKFLDKNFKLKNSSWKNVNQLLIQNHKLELQTDKGVVKLEDDSKYLGYRLDKEKISAIILKNNNLHIEIIINPSAFSAKGDPAGISDIIMNQLSLLFVIMKTLWLQLMLRTK